MTLILELSPDTERAIEQEAQQRGVNAAIVAGEVLSVWAQTKQQNGTAVTGEAINGEGAQSTLSPRQQAAMRGYGMLAGRGRTVDDFLRERREEAEMEMQQATRRDAERAARLGDEAAA